MITKERLEELIKQKQPIYYKDYYIIYPSKWRYGYAIPEQLECLYKKPFNKLIWYDLIDLYGSKEERDWHREFENITRTETLKLPTWEKIKRKPTIISFMSKDWKLCKLGLGEIVAVIGNGTKSSKKRYVCVCIDKDDHYFERTEKGYIEACELCRKLFLGEEV